MRSCSYRTVYKRLERKSSKVRLDWTADQSWLRRSSIWSIWLTPFIREQLRRPSPDPLPNQQWEFSHKQISNTPPERLSDYYYVLAHYKLLRCAAAAGQPPGNRSSCEWGDSQHSIVMLSARNNCLRLTGRAREMHCNPLHSPATEDRQFITEGVGRTIYCTNQARSVKAYIPTSWCSFGAAFDGSHASSILLFTTGNVPIYSSLQFICIRIN